VWSVYRLTSKRRTHVASKSDYDYSEMWEVLKHRLEKRVERMRFDSGDRRGAYEDVLLVMGDIEDSED
jgi:hypothetical protein